MRDLLVVDPRDALEGVLDVLDQVVKVRPAVFPVATRRRPLRMRKDRVEAQTDRPLQRRKDAALAHGDLADQRDHLLVGNLLGRVMHPAVVVRWPHPAQQRPGNTEDEVVNRHGCHQHTLSGCG